MADNKVNMALDDIIKMNKKQQKTKVTRNVRGKQQQKGRGTKPAVARKTNTTAKRGAPSISNVQTKRLVQKLVKKALKTRMAATALRNNAVVRRGGVRARVAVTRPAINRVNARSRVIGQRRTVVQPAAVIRRGRGRGFVQPRTTVVYEDEYVSTAPVRRAPVIERVVAPVQARQRVVVRRQAPRRNVVVQQPRRIIIQPAQRTIVRPAARRIVVAQQPRVMAQPRVVQRVQQRTIRRGRPAVQQSPRVEYVQNAGRGNFRNRRNNNERFQKNERFRSAIGRSRNYQQQIVDRFEPSTSFISGHVVRRGRGFNNNY